MTKPIIPPQDNYIGAWGATFIIVSLVTAIVYAMLYGEVPDPRYEYLKVFNPAAIWFSFWILLTGTFTGLLLLGISKCIGELSAIRILMNEEAGRTHTGSLTIEAPEENTHEPKTPAETKLT